MKCGAIRKNSVIYLTHPIFRMYYEYGAQIHRDYFINALNLLYKSPVAKVIMPSVGRIHFIEQIKEKRYVLHLLYASPIQRGKALVIEDMPPIYNVEATLKVDKDIKKVYLAPQMKEIPFTRLNNVLSMVIPEVKCHQIVVLDY